MRGFHTHTHTYTYTLSLSLIISFSVFLSLYIIYFIYNILISKDFARALYAPDSAENSTVEYIQAISDWVPIHQQVRREKIYVSNQKKRDHRDETREGLSYTLLRWPLLVILLIWIAILSITYGIVRLFVNLSETIFTWRGDRQVLRKRLRKAETYEEWISAAQDLDTCLGNEEWKDDENYAYYDYKLLRQVTNTLQKYRKTNDMEGLLLTMDSCIKANYAGIESSRLYSETYYGTKNLIEEYLEELNTCIGMFLKSTEISADVKRTMFRRWNTTYGKTALCLSGGACFAYYHFGVVRALLDASLLPRVVTGTSGGGIVAALVCTHNSEELKQLIVPELAHKITACNESLSVGISRWWRTGARFSAVDWAKKSSFFTRGDTTFKEAYERTGRILNVSVIPHNMHSPPKLINYITAPDCVIWSALIASAAVPGILNPVVLMMKTKSGKLVPYNFGHRWKDGSLRTDIPVQQLNMYFNVNFSVVSQTNPHISIFFYAPRGSVGRPVSHRKGRGWRGGFLASAMEQYLKLELNKNLKVLRDLELLPRPLGQDWSSIWLQRFDGNVTIWPKTVPSDFWYILSDPTPERLERMILFGKRATFPKLKMIKNRLSIERLIQQGRKTYKTKPKNIKNGSNNINNISEESDLELMSRNYDSLRDSGFEGGRGGIRLRKHYSEPIAKPHPFIDTDFLDQNSVTGITQTSLGGKDNSDESSDEESFETTEGIKGMENLTPLLDRTDRVID